MRAWVLVILLSLAGGVGALPLLEQVRVAHACSCPDCDAFRDSPVVVRGTVTGWEFVRDAAGNPVEHVEDEPACADPTRQPHSRPIRLSVSVTAVYRGQAPAVILLEESLYDRYVRAEGSPVTGEWLWPGAAGVCFAMASDPTGRDAMLALVPSATPGHFRLAVGPFLFDDGSGRTFAERFPSLGSPEPPAAGNSPAAGPAGAASDDWLFISAISVASLLLTLLLLLCGPRRDRPRR